MRVVISISNSVGKFNVNKEPVCSSFSALRAELRVLLIKPLGDRGKECQLRLPLSLGLFSQLRGASRSAGGFVYRGFPRLDFPSAICQKAGSPRISPLPFPFFARPSSPFSPSIPIPPTSSSAPRNASLPFQTNSPRFTLPNDRIVNHNYCERPPLLPSPVSLGVFFNRHALRCSCLSSFLLGFLFGKYEGSL